MAIKHFDYLRSAEYLAINVNVDDVEKEVSIGILIIEPRSENILAIGERKIHLFDALINQTKPITITEQIFEFADHDDA